MFRQRPSLVHPVFFLHAFSNPLTSILLNCELLQQGKLNAAERDHCLANIRHQHHYLQALATKTWSLETGNFLLNAAILEVITRYHRPFADEYAYAFLDTPPSMSLSGNVLSFQEMLCCLLKNAFDSYLPDRSKKVVLTTTYTGEKVSLTISDNGRGWSRLDQWRSRCFGQSHKKGHRGLGWRFCCSVARELNGRLRVSSQRGIGTSITLTLELCTQNRERF